jgi:CheY-like chemotaxis protein
MTLPPPASPAYPPEIPGARPVLAVVSDLFFRAKIDEVARHLGLPLRVAKSPEQLERHLAAARPALALVDLEADTLDPIAAVRRLGEAEGGPTPVVGFAGHANVDALRAARAAGAEVLARSALQTRMPQLLARVAEEERARAEARGSA